MPGDDRRPVTAGPPLSRLYKASYYNRAIDDGPSTLLYNGVTAGLMRLPPDLAEQVEPFLGPRRPITAGRGLDGWDPPRFEAADLPGEVREVFDELLRGRFFVPADEDELELLRSRDARARANDPFLITITTTLDCNFDCYYCYEDKSPVYLSRELCDRIVDFIDRRLEERSHRKVYTDWYGGEPMLNREAIEYVSERALALCESRGVGYSSGLISNGTHWPEDARGFVERARINHVQITLDGPRRHHDTRRAYKKGSGEGGGRGGSFDEVVATIDRLVGATRLYLRINVDPKIGRSALELVDLLLERGWLGPGRRFYPYLAPIGPMTRHCGFIGASDKFRRFHDEFEGIKSEFQRRIAGHLEPRDLEHLEIYPSARPMSCAAVGENSVVFGPDGLMYKCGLDVGAAERAFDRLAPPRSTAAGDGPGALPVVDGRPVVGADAHPYHTYDPFSHERCSQCQFLPVCLGGCPKTRFEENEFYLSRRSAYWEANFERLIRTYADAARPRD